MEKLEIKHVAPYLPYGLKVSTIHTLIAENGIGNINHIVKAVNEGKSQYKPILRPLSDLTKEIEHNGEKFVPLDVLKYLFPNTPNWKIYHLDWIKRKVDLNTTIVEYCIVQKLFEYNFDVFGLIDKGLAIDINTV